MALAIASLLAADSVRSLPMTSLRVLPCEMWRNEAFNDNVCGFACFWIRWRAVSLTGPEPENPA